MDVHALTVATTTLKALKHTHTHTSSSILTHTQTYSLIQSKKHIQSSKIRFQNAYSLQIHTHTIYQRSLTRILNVTDPTTFIRRHIDGWFSGWLQVCVCVFLAGVCCCLYIILSCAARALSISPSHQFDISLSLP